MLTRAVLLVAVLFAVPMWSQTGTDTGTGTQTPADETQMIAPPPVSGAAFPTQPIEVERSNYLNLGFTSSVAYMTNVFPGQGLPSVSDESYSIYPTVALDRHTARLRETFSYDPGFTFYQNVSTLNQSTENASGTFSFLSGPHSTITANDTFSKTSSPFSQPFSLVPGTISGASPGQEPLLIAPYADEIVNNGTGEFTQQVSRVSMVGASGGVSELDFPNPNQAPGLYNANGYSAEGFYNGRISKGQYIGTSYRYSSVTEDASNGSGVTIQTNAIEPFYSYNVRENISLSVTGGPQFYRVTAPGTAPVSGVGPSINASAHLGTARGVFSLSYTRTVTGGGGLVGAFTMNEASIYASLRLNRGWSVGASGSYINNRSVIPGSIIFEQGGHSLVGMVSVNHRLSEHLSAELGYNYFRQDYGSIAVASSSPSSQRVYGTISYTLRRPLGR
jgi:hypothetical protein